eukprot:m.190569 g.190569  ORF g.190569 m.190569 type:complete len:66 (+) comp14822_c0_seq2:236-433(+)
MCGLCQGESCAKFPTVETGCCLLLRLCDGLWGCVRGCLHTTITTSHSQTTPVVFTKVASLFHSPQ